jgi:hypothetical protein
MRYFTLIEISRYIFEWLAAALACVVLANAKYSAQLAQSLLAVASGGECFRSGGRNSFKWSSRPSERTL